MIDYYEHWRRDFRDCSGIAEQIESSTTRIETHMRLLTERYVQQGMTEAEAALAARRQFGNVTLLQEAHSEMRRIRLIDTTLKNLPLCLT